jgi:3-methyladenine DNA glycosylase AlkD
VAVPQLRQVVRTFARQLKDTSDRRVIAIAGALARRGTVEGRQVGYELLARRPGAMAMLAREAIERLGRGNDNWASVDGFAMFITGPAWRQGRLADADVRGWSRSPNPWWRRTALASTVALNLRARGGTGDTRRTLMICAALAADRNPMLAKALSWALRSLVPYDPAAVREFLATYPTLPALVRREVTAKLATGHKMRPRSTR